MTKNKRTVTPGEFQPSFIFNDTIKTNILC